MGQSSSTQRDHRRISLSDHFALFRTGRGRENRHEAMSDGRNFEQPGEAGPPSRAEIFDDNVQFSPSLQPGAAAELPEQSTLLDSWQARHSETQEGNGLGFDLSHQQDYQDYRSATFARMTARRQSTMSRLGSRILPNSVIRGLLSSEEETPAEGHAHRHGVSRSIPRSEVVHNSSRFSPFSSLSSRGIARRRELRGPYFIPRSDPTLAPDTSASADFDPASERARESNRGSWRRSARLHRVRRSLSNPLSHMFGQPSTGISSSNTESAAHPPSLGDGPYHLFPPSRELDSRMDFDEPHELDSVEPAVQNPRPSSSASNQSEQGVASARQLPGLLRARPSRVLRREEQMPMSRVLQLAAAAIAAQLSGTTSPVLPNIQALGNDGLDGSLENFIQSLQNATSTQTSPSDTLNTAGESGPSPPLNFLRVFRFANSDPARTSGTANRPSTGSDSVNPQADGMDADNQREETGAEGRTVTLVVVGVRLVPASNGPSSDQPNPGHDLDALLRMPFLSPGMRSTDGGSSLPTRRDGPSRLFPNRLSRGPGALSTNDDMLHQPESSSVPHRLSDAGTGSPLSSNPNSSPASPPGPHPPPSTPAEPGLSTSVSGASTPSRRPSSASAMSPNTLPQVHENQLMQPSVEPAEDHVPFNTTRQRRRSDSEYARHRNLGAGSNRRNGVVEPDNATPPVGRSWLIYVVGANVSENNLAFATPSLFTDVRFLPVKYVYLLVGTPLT